MEHRIGEVKSIAEIMADMAADPNAPIGPIIRHIFADASIDQQTEAGLVFANLGAGARKTLLDKLMRDLERTQGHEI